MLKGCSRAEENDVVIRAMKGNQRNTISKGGLNPIGVPCAPSVDHGHWADVLIIVGVVS